MSNPKITRTPVICPNGKPLMPTTPARAAKWIKAGKAIGKRNKLGVFYVQLTAKPSGYKTQNIVAGCDRGKALQTVETHANDAIALASSAFLRYETFQALNLRGGRWIGECRVTAAPFIVITRPKLFRRKLHQEQYCEGGILKRQGGTITPFGFCSGDYVETSRKGETIRGWIGGFTQTRSSSNVSIYNHNWSRIGQFNPKNVRLLSRSSRLCVVR